MSTAKKEVWWEWSSSVAVENKRENHGNIRHKKAHRPTVIKNRTMFLERKKKKKKWSDIGFEEEMGINGWLHYMVWTVHMYLLLLPTGWMMEEEEEEFDIYSIL